MQRWSVEYTICAIRIPFSKCRRQRVLH